MTDAMEAHAHEGLHSELGALRGEHPGRSRNPLIKVHDIAWLRFEKPDLVRAEAFARAFGFKTEMCSAEELRLRGSDPGAPCVMIRRGERSRFAGVAFKAHDEVDVLRLAEAMNVKTRPLSEEIGGLGVTVTDPSGLPVEVVAGMHELPELAHQQPQVIYVGHDITRSNNTQRPPRVPATVQRLGHMVYQTTVFRRSLQWYLETFGMLVSDFQYYHGQRGRGPILAFIRCDRGTAITDHHSLVLTLGAENRYVHSAYQVCDLDALAAGGEYLLDKGYIRSWGIGRHIQGSQIFDYWRDPDGFLVEHFIDSDMFDNTIEPGWAPLTASGLRQWGSMPSNDFLGTDFKGLRQETKAVLSALRNRNNEFDLRSLIGMMRVARS
jgi:Glyoxalase/Bleomycin resistance protein/Dioxygenase superfamily